jgi:hypothetical protein
MAGERFPGSDVLTIGDLEFELVETGASGATGVLDRLREQVLALAAGSRGWDEPQHLEFFRRTFKIEPFYEATALALVRQRGVLVGMAGSVNDWQVDEGSIVHLCTLGFLPRIQGRGLLPVLMALLWQATLRKPSVRRDFERGRLFLTAITQSPYILWFMSRLSELFPGPDRQAPTDEEQRVARRVAQRFDGHLDFDDRTFILRNECEFRYRRLPRSLDRRLNRFCDRSLRYDQGDVFVVVGRADQAKVEAFLDQVREAFGDLLATFESRRAPQSGPSPDEGETGAGKRETGSRKR